MLIEEAKMKGRFRCADCGVCTKEIGEYYMVTRKVWQAADAGDIMLCIGCLENRLGRELTGSDFLPCECNCGVRAMRSDRLKSRLPPSGARFVSDWWHDRDEVNWELLEE